MTWEEHIALHFTSEQRAHWLERAAIREYDAKTARPQADHAAYFETCRFFSLAAVGDEQQLTLPLSPGQQIA